jgi:hypothetical protein
MSEESHQEKVDNCFMSSQIDKLAEALSKAQSCTLLAKEGSKNPFFKSNYASLSELWASCRKPLTDNGLSVTQMPYESGNGFKMVTLLLHKSGQWIKSEVQMITPKTDPQSFGSICTYYRRYTLAALVGLAPGDKDDDDGERGMKDARAPKEQDEQVYFQKIKQILVEHSIDPTHLKKYLESKQKTHNATAQAILEHMMRNESALNLVLEDYINFKP